MQRNTYQRPQQRNENRLTLVEQEGNDGFKSVFPYQKSLIGRLLWTGKDSVMRIVPGNDGKHVFPQVINQDIWTSDGDMTQYLSDTFYMVDTVDHFGDASMDFVSSLRPGSQDQEMYPESPVNYFCNTIHRAVRATANGKKTRVKVQDIWRSWTNLGGILPYPRETLFFQAICEVLNGTVCKDGFEEDSQPAPLYVVVGLKHIGSIKELLKALVSPMDRRRPIGTDNNTFGALAELEGNMLYLNTSFDDKGKRILIPSVQPSDAPTNKWEPREYPVSETDAKTIWVPWDRVFKYLTAKEQVELLTAEFGSDTVQYIFSLERRWDGLVSTAKTVAVSRPQYKAPQPKKQEPVLEAPEEEETEEEPSWEPPKKPTKMSSEMEAEIAKIRNKISGGGAASLAKSMLDDFEDADLG